MNKNSVKFDFVSRKKIRRHVGRDIAGGLKVNRVLCGGVCQKDSVASVFWFVDLDVVEEPAESSRYSPIGEELAVDVADFNAGVLVERDT